MLVKSALRYVKSSDECGWRDLHFVHFVLATPTLTHKPAEYAHAAEVRDPEANQVLAVQSGTHNFANAREAMESPLARRLFSVEGVKGVFFGSDFVTVTKAEDAAWPLIKPEIFAQIMDYYASGEPLFVDAATRTASDTAIHADDDEARLLLGTPRLLLDCSARSQTLPTSAWRRWSP